MGLVTLQYRVWIALFVSRRAVRYKLIIAIQWRRSLAKLRLESARRKFAHGQGNRRRQLRRIVLAAFDCTQELGQPDLYGLYAFRQALEDCAARYRR